MFSYPSPVSGVDHGPSVICSRMRLKTARSLVCLITGITNKVFLAKQGNPLTDLCAALQASEPPE